MSRRQAEACKPEPGDVLISIRSCGDRLPELQPGWAEVLSVECDDMSFRDWRTNGRGKMLTLETATRLIAWAHGHQKAPRMVVHCDAGISRSVTTAHALRVFRGQKIPAGTVIPNPGLLAILMEAWGWWTRDEWYRSRGETYPSVME